MEANGCVDLSSEGVRVCGCHHLRTMSIAYQSLDKAGGGRRMDGNGLARMASVQLEEPPVVKHAWVHMPYLPILFRSPRYNLVSRRLKPLKNTHAFVERARAAS
jgi:hypothetical protein